MKGRSRVLSIASLMLLTSCFGRAPDVSSYVVTQVSGNVQFREGEETGFKPVATGLKLTPRAVIRVLSESHVALTRGVDSSVRLRPFDPSERCMDLRGTDRVDCSDRARSEIAPPAQMTIETMERIDVSSGDVLVRSSSEAPISVGSNGVSASTGGGTFRFDRRLSLRVAVYEGTTTVAAAGAALALPSLREGVVAGRELPGEPALLRFRSTDPWDRELLKDVIDLDNEIQAQRSGYEGNFGRRTSDVGDEMEALAEMAPEGDIDFLRPSLRRTRKGDVLVGLVFALLLEQAGKGSASQHYETLLDLLDQGATWGFLARDNGVAAEDLIGGVVRAIGLRTGEVDPGTTITGPTPAPTGTASPGPTPTGTATRSPRPTRSPSPSPSPTRSPSPSPSPSKSPSPSPSPTETCVNVGPLCVG